MLQIATGKLFTSSVSRENQLRGMLYTNAVIGYEESVETVVGRLLPSSSIALQPQVVLYKLTERMEGNELAPGVLVSSGIDPYLQDFAVVVAFALNCVCTPDIDLCRRLTNGRRGISTRESPNTLVHRFFDSSIWCTQEDRKFLTEFTAKLIGMPRQTFLGVMRSLRTFINGMYRIADDLELAYTLLVASVESLAQDFDEHRSDWESLDERKRIAIDRALDGADSALSQRVRDAVLAVEHVALGRRFREFVISHTKPDYFRPEVKPNGSALGRSDLSEVLGLAYQSRSKYVHQLKRLPHMVAIGHQFGEMVTEGRATRLTLQGLSRLMRNVIIEFVQKQPIVQREPYNYAFERSGVVQMKMAAQYWVGRTDGDIRTHGRDKLEGFLQQLASLLLKEPNAVITDLRPVLEQAAEWLPMLDARLRLPYLALFVAFNAYVREQDQALIPSSVDALIEKELAKCGPESLLVHTLCGQVPAWPAEEHAQALDAYFRRRSAKNGLWFPRLFETALRLDLAERYRLAGNMHACAHTVALAVENQPGHVGLLEFEHGLKAESPIRWQEILLPSSE